LPPTFSTPKESDEVTHNRQKMSTIYRDVAMVLESFHQKKGAVYRSSFFFFSFY